MATLKLRRGSSFTSPQISEPFFNTYNNTMLLGFGTTNGEHIPEWFWLLTDQGILGHIIRENDYKVNSLSNQVSLSHHNIVNGDQRYKGKAEKWYTPLKPDIKKQVDFEHVWLDKINTQNLAIKRWFKEAVEILDCGKYLQDIRWEKHWRDYHENN